LRCDGYNGKMRTRLAALAALIAAGALGASGCGGAKTPATTGSQGTVAATAARHGPGPAHKRSSQHTHHAGSHNAPREESDRAAVQSAVSQTPVARLDARQRLVAAVVRRYVNALDSRNGAAVCSLFVPGALNPVKLPRQDAGCGASVTASIGYRDPRGFPVYCGSRVARIRSVKLDGTDARVVATTVTHFAGNREPSIEDDVVYLEQRGGHWLIVKPSAALYRAIGVGNIPPSVLAPPT
jgi:hypothetical protein